MASRGVKTAPRGKPSGLPFHARFTDVAAQAGLKHVVVSRPHEARRLRPRSDELRGRILRLRQRRLDGHSRPLGIPIRRSARRRLQPALQKQSRRHLHRRHPRGPDCCAPDTPTALPSATTTTTASKICSSPAGGRTCCIATTATALSPMSRRTPGLLERASRDSGPGCAFVDYDRDGRLDLFVSNYVAFDLQSMPRAGTRRVATGRRVLRAARAALRPPLPVSQQRRRHIHRRHRQPPASPKPPGGYGLTVVAADFDNDGWPDIYVACDSTPSLLFRNNHDGTFTEQALETGRRPQRRRNGAGRHGPGGRRFSPRRQSSHRQDAFRERHARSST